MRRIGGDWARLLFSSKMKYDVWRENICFEGDSPNTKQQRRGENLLLCSLPECQTSETSLSSCGQGSHGLFNLILSGLMAQRGEWIRQQVWGTRQKDELGERTRWVGKSVSQVRKDIGAKVGKAAFCFPSLGAVSSLPCRRGERPTSSFVYPGMRDVLTGRLFSAQLSFLLWHFLRTSPVCTGVCVCSIICAVSVNQAKHRETACRETQSRDVCVKSRETPRSYPMPFLQVLTRHNEIVLSGITLTAEMYSP